MPSLPHAQRQRILARDGHKCLKCGATKDLTIDHIIPQALGGHSYDVNLQILDAECNHFKGSQIISYRNDPKVDQMITEFKKGRATNGFGHKFDEQKVDRARRHAAEVVARNKMLARGEI